MKEFVDYLTSWYFMNELVGKLIRVIIILLVAKIFIKLINPVIIQFFEKQKKLKMNVDINRINTMKGLILSLVKYVIYFIAFTSIANLFINVTGLVATAGVGGLAIGFGAQNLVRDVITGFFILFEEQFNVGSFIQLENGVSGVVEEMALRVTKIRDFNGDLHIIPNGEIKRVTNKSNGKMRATVEMSIAYEEDIDRAIGVLNIASEKLKEENPNIIEGPTVLGVSRLGDSDVGITVMAKTVPMEQWATERLMRKTFKQAFDREGIEIPYPRRVVIQKSEAKDER